jgi:diacylglycerol kinase family enzyme
MGIVPWGSGNGLARFLKIPLRYRAAIARLNEVNIKTIDSAELNDRKFFNMAGIGFDAHISALFATNSTRGLRGYVETTLTEVSQYKPQFYRINIDGREIERQAFMVSIANSSQFGNNAHLAPKASVQDGLLDVCIIKPFPLYHFPVLGLHMFLKTADKSKYVEIIKGRKIKITREARGAVHVDGEPVEMGKSLNIMVNPLSLKILT